MKNLMQWKDKVFFVLLALVFLRLLIMALSYNYGMLYLARQMFYTLAWGQVAYFMMNYNPLKADEEANEAETFKMKTIAFWTMIICIAKAVVYVYFNWPIVSNMVWPTVYNILEPVAWIMLAVYFYHVYASRRDQFNRINKQSL